MIVLIAWEYIFSLFDIILAKKFGDIFLQEKKMDTILQIFYQLLFALLIFSVSYIHVLSYVLTLLIITILSCYCLLIYEASTLYKFVISIIFYLIYSIFSIGCVSLVAILLGDSAKLIYEYGSVIRVIFILTTRVIAFVCLLFIQNRRNKEKISMLITHNMFFVIVVGSATMLILTNLLYDNTLSDNAKDMYYLVFGIVLLAVLFIVLFKALMDEKAKRVELQVQKEVLEMQTNNLEYMNTYDTEIRSMKHDIKNNLYSVETLIKEKKYSEAEEYLNTLTQIPALNKVYQSGNPIIDSLLNVSIQMNPKIAFHVTLAIDHCSIDYDVISIILGNALSNAIEATNRNIEQNNDIFIEINENKKRVIFIIENGYKDKPIIEQGKIISSKGDKENHGFGIYNIRKAARKYDGKVNYDIDTQKQIFKIIILLVKK